MTKAIIVTLADEVVKDLNAKSSSWEQSFQAERKYLPKEQLEDTDVLKVTVAIGGWRKGVDNRTEWFHEYDIDIGFQYRPNPKAGDQPQDKFDPLLRLMEQASDHYEDTRPALADCVLTEVSFGGPAGSAYYPEHINQFNQFTGVIRLTFRKWR